MSGLARQQELQRICLGTVDCFSKESLTSLVKRKVDTRGEIEG